MPAEDRYSGWGLYGNRKYKLKEDRLDHVLLELDVSGQIKETLLVPVDDFRPLTDREMRAWEGDFVVA